MKSPTGISLGNRRFGYMCLPRFRFQHHRLLGKCKCRPALLRIQRQCMERLLRGVPSGTNRWLGQGLESAR